MKRTKMKNEEIQHDIKVINAFKSYGQNTILNGLHMNVQSESIYGLLGASGCGKTTILECILGKIKLDSGSIHLRADHLRDIGYMPQDLCLEDTLTIKEILEYYGTIYKMTKEHIESKIISLSTFLQLPDLNKLIKNISGGQSRRVSLAVSILHDPKIIILDEPTVGIDPLLRQKVWEEFTRMAEQSKKTIIITTHYIEEANKANTIGFMRNGVIVEEGVPQNILTKYETNSLESAFLTLCCKQDEHEHIATIHTQNVHKREIVYAQSTNFIESGTSIDFIRIKALMKKNIKVFFREYMFLMMMFVLPIIQALSLGYAIGINIKGIQISVKNDEINLSDCDFSKTYECIFNETSNQRISCIVMNNLISHNYQLKVVKDFDEGEAKVKNYESSAFLHFPQNFTADLSYYLGEDRMNYNLESSIYASFIKDNLIIKNQVIKDVIDSVKLIIEKTLDSCSLNPKALSVPIDFDVIQGKEVKSYLNYGAALFLATGGFFLTGTFAMTVLLSEKMDGLLSRSMLAGVTVMDLLISLLFIDTILYVIQMTLPLILAYAYFDNPLPITGNLFVYFFMLFTIGWIGFCFGATIVGLSSSKLLSVYAMNGLFMSLFLLSGFAWPIEGQFLWLRTISELLPTTLAGNTMNDIALRNWAWNHPSIVYNLIILVSQLIVLILFLFGLSKVKRDTWIMSK